SKHSDEGKPKDATGVLASLKNNGTKTLAVQDDSTITINRDTVVGATKSFTTTGDVLVQSEVNSANAFRIQNAGGGNLLVADTSKNTVTINGALVSGGGLRVNGDINSVTNAYSLSAQ